MVNVSPVAETSAGTQLLAAAGLTGRKGAFYRFKDSRPEPLTIPLKATPIRGTLYGSR
jgi:hypothetical protein